MRDFVDVFHNMPPVTYLLTTALKFCLQILATYSVYSFFATSDGLQIKYEPSAFLLNFSGFISLSYVWTYIFTEPMTMLFSYIKFTKASAILSGVMPFSNLILTRSSPFPYEFGIEKIGFLFSIVKYNVQISKFSNN